MPTTAFPIGSIIVTISVLSVLTSPSSALDRAHSPSRVSPSAVNKDPAPCFSPSLNIPKSGNTINTKRYQEQNIAGRMLSPGQLQHSGKHCRVYAATSVSRTLRLVEKDRDRSFSHARDGKMKQAGQTKKRPARLVKTIRSGFMRSTTTQQHASG